MTETFCSWGWAGRDVLERSLEVTEVLWGVGGGDGDMKPDCAHFERKIETVYRTYLLMNLG